VTARASIGSAKRTIDLSAFICHPQHRNRLDYKFRECHEDPFASAARSLGWACSPPDRSRSAAGSLLDFKTAEKAENRGNRYLYEISKNITIDGAGRSNVARYANHSCNPNADTYSVKHRVFIRALRNIKPGEEIVYDYGIDYLKNVIGRSNCKCSRCRRRRNRRAAELRLKRLRKAKRQARLRATKRRGKKR
jgi:hypothetical protein